MNRESGDQLMINSSELRSRMEEWLELETAPEPHVLPTPVRRQLAEAAAREQKYELALALTDLETPDATPLWAIDVRALALVGLGRHADAIALLEARIERSPAISASRQLALAHIAEGDHLRAQVIADQLTSEHPDAVSAWTAAGEIGLELGDLDRAGSAFEHALELSATSSGALAGLARTLLRRGDVASASGLLRPAAEQGFSALVFEALAESLEAAEEWKDAASYRAAIEERRREARAALRDRLSAAPAPVAAEAPVETSALGPALPALNVDDSAPPDLEEALHKYFGFTSFRPGQAAVCRAMLDGRNTLAIMPTGAGKSLCYQLPSMLLDGVTLVISPLVALMKDQVDGLPPAVYPQATLINSTLPSSQIRDRLDRLAAGDLKLVYVAPERLRSAALLGALRRGGVARVVVDEAHCVSAWGHDFRPDYLAIGRALDQLGDPPVLAVTATAPTPVQADIARQLGRNFAVLQTPLFRSNLRYEVLKLPNAEAKLEAIRDVCLAESGSGIIYVNSRRRAEDISQVLRRAGVQAAAYHAGFDPAERTKVQDDFMLDRVRVICATVAFGMGVDKANIRFIVHFSLPESLEAYVQESGRAGRDDRPARCILLVAPADKANLTRWLKAERLDVDDLRQVYRQVRSQLSAYGRVDERSLRGVLADPAGTDDDGTRCRVAVSLLEQAGLLRRQPDDPSSLELLPAPGDAASRLERLLAEYGAFQDARIRDIVGYAEGLSCRHTTILRHFNQSIEPPCGACDICSPSPAAESRAVRQAKRVGSLGTTASMPPAAAILGCLAEAPFPMGKKGLVRTLIGSVAAPLDAGRSKYFGVLSGMSASAIERTIDRLIGEGYLERDVERDLPVFALTPKAHQGPPDWDQPTPTRTNAASEPFEEEFDIDCFERLRAWRRKLAAEHNVAPFTILPDRALRALASIPPNRLDLEAIAAAPGIGPARLERFGETLLSLLRASDPT